MNYETKHEGGIMTARFVVAAFLLAAAAIFLQAHSHGEVFPPRQTLDSFPEQLGPWTGTDVTIDKEILDVLGPGDFLLRSYQDDALDDAAGSASVPTPAGTAGNSAEPNIDLFIAYFRSQRAGDTIHSPKNCLPGAGWAPIDNRRITLSVAGHAPFPANRYIIAKGDTREVVLYWYWAHDRGVASEYWAKYYLVADSIRMNRSDGALVRVSSAMLAGETASAAESRMLPFTGSVVPLLNSYIPR
jgi:EpsI family protein